jgi:bifunctional UDP-N-acetylglucosamine pyrophosphorylase/glucosamine-1-phosphate N-acetyltransferase
MIAIIVAGGKGTRMESDIPKCVVPLLKKPMICYLIETLKQLNIEKIYIVVSYKKEEVKRYIKEKVIFIEQAKPLGTGDAVKSCKNVLVNVDENILILAADMPLIKKEVLTELINTHIMKNNDLTILSTTMDKPIGFGRIIKKNNKIIKITEEKELLTEENINEVNTSVYCIKSKVLMDNIDRINNYNQSSEYYFTDIVELLSTDYRIDVYNTEYTYHLQGINDYQTLKEVERKMRFYERIN